MAAWRQDGPERSRLAVIMGTPRGFCLWWWYTRPERPERSEMRKYDIVWDRRCSFSKARESREPRKAI